jgi:hypothetical protein
MMFAALAGCAFGLASAMAARVTLRRSRRLSGSTAPAITLLKPLHGAERGLEAALAGFLTQDYAGPIQVVFGLRYTGDPAMDAVEKIRRRFPGRDIAVVVEPRLHGTNRKISNVVNMMKAAKHDFLVLTDADITVPSDYLTTIAAAAARPGVGLVSCLYSGRGSGNFWSRFAAMGISYHFLPNAALGLAIGLVRPCFGSTIALSRQTLDRIGGFEAFLQAPSFDGFDGGAGSRYQAKREIKSFWYPTWLAQPAALVENSKLIDAPPHARASPTCCRWRRTSTSWSAHLDAVVRLGREDRRGAEGRQPALKAGMIGAKVAVDAEGSLRERAGDRLRRPQRVRLHHQGRRRRQALGDRSGLSYRNPPASSSTTTTGRSSRTWTRCRS